MSLTAVLIERAYQAADDPRAQVAARWTLFDYLACVTAGRKRTALGDAAACAVLDLDDVHWGTGTHPGSMVWPSADPDSRDAVRAAIIGYEVAIRAARAFGQDHRRLWHPSSTAGVLGAAAAAAVASGCSTRGVVSCVSRATSLVAGLGQGILEEADSVILHRLYAHRTALLCVEAVDLRPASEGLEGDRGALAAFGGDPGPILAPVEIAAITEVSFRLLPVTGLLQDFAEAAQALDPPADGERVEVVLPLGHVELVDRAHPRSDRDRWWSAQWVVAACLLGVSPDDRSDAMVDVHRLSQRVDVRAGDVAAISIGADTREVQRREATAEDLLAKWDRLNPGREAPVGLLA